MTLVYLNKNSNFNFKLWTYTYVMCSKTWFLKEKLTNLTEIKRNRVNTTRLPESDKNKYYVKVKCEEDYLWSSMSELVFVLAFVK